MTMHYVYLQPGPDGNWEEIYRIPFSTEAELAHVLITVRIQWEMADRAFPGQPDDFRLPWGMALAKELIEDYSMWSFHSSAIKVED